MIHHKQLVDQIRICVSYARNITISGETSTIQTSWIMNNYHRLLQVRDGPNTTTTVMFQKCFASDATPKRHLMAHQMKNLYGSSVFHYLEGAFGVASGDTPRMKNGTPRDALKNARGRGWAVTYQGAAHRDAILLKFCSSPNPFSCNKMNLFYLKVCTFMKGTR